MADGPIFVLAGHTPPVASEIPDVLEKACELLARTANDPHRLDLYLEVLRDCRRRNESNSDDGLNSRIRAAAVTVFETLAATLREQHPRAAGERELAELKAAVSTRKNVLPVFRHLSDGGCRRNQILSATGLADEALQRVLRWGLANGLVSYEPSGDESYYRLTRLGELVVEAIDEPTWLHLSGNLVRAAMKLRVAGKKASSVAAEVITRLSRTTGLTPQAVQHGLNTMFRATDPVSASSLAGSLSMVAGERKGILLFSSAREERPRARLTLSQNPEVLLMRALERVGVFSVGVEEPSVREFVTFTSEGHWLNLPIDRPIVSCSLRSAVTQTLSLAFGDLIRLEEGKLVVRGQSDEGDSVQYVFNEGGIVVRIYDIDRGVTHLIVGGLDTQSRLAASRFCYDRLEDLISEKPECSFAVYVAPDAVFSSLIRLETSPPEPDTVSIEWIRTDQHSHRTTGRRSRFVINDQRREDRQEVESTSGLVAAGV